MIMMEIRTVSIIGLGALGTLFANHLSKRMSKTDLRIIADKDRIKKYKINHIYCNGDPCEFNYMMPKELCKPADLIIFTVKYDGLNDAIQAIRNQVGEQTIILSALNGITSEAVIGETYGMDKILHCVAQGMDAVKIGNKLTYEHMGMLCFGEVESGIISSKVKKVTEFFEKMKFPYEAVNDMNKRIWGKFMLNVGVNQTVAVYKSNYGEIQKEGQSRNIMISAMREVMLLSEIEGINLNEDDLNYWLKILGTLSPAGKPSMRQDLEAKRYSEVELFSGTVIKMGEKYCIPTPINQQLYDKIKFVESQY